MNNHQMANRIYLCRNSLKLAIAAVHIGSLVIFFILIFCPYWCVATDTLLVKNFIIKSQIILLNQKPSQAEITEAINKYDLLNNPRNKNAYIESLFSSSTFSKAIYNLYINEFLQGVNDDLVNLTIKDYQFLLTNRSQTVFHDEVDSTLQKAERLKLAIEQLRRHEITITELQLRCMDNKFYDDKNMGADNFVVSTFMYLFSRNPTQYELDEGKKMYNRQSGILFNQIGISKEDYLKIIYNSYEYKEGQVKYWYQRILSRNPTEKELINEVYANYRGLEKIIGGILCSTDFAKF